MRYRYTNLGEIASQGRPDEISKGVTVYARLLGVESFRLERNGSEQNSKIKYCTVDLKKIVYKLTIVIENEVEYNADVANIVPIEAKS
jgi:hypothetical protein